MPRPFSFVTLQQPARIWMLSVFSIRSAISTSTKSFPAKWPVWMMTRSFFNWINSFSRRTRLSAASALSLSVSLAVTTRCHFCRNSVACSMSFFCRSYSVPVFTAALFHPAPLPACNRHGKDHPFYAETCTKLSRRSIRSQ